MRRALAVLLCLGLTGASGTHAASVSSGVYRVRLVATVAPAQVEKMVLVR